MLTIENNIYEINGTEDGPCVALMGAVHGNEKIGVEVINTLLKDLAENLVRGKIYCILGNPVAYEKNIRFVDEDMNRLFGKGNIETLQKKNIEDLNIEQKRAIELSAILKNADYLLDIHSTGKPSIPFVFIENAPEHQRLAQTLNVKYIVSNAKTGPEDMNSCTDNFVNRNGGVGLTYESGHLSDYSVFHEILDRTKCFLQEIGIAYKNHESTFPQKEHIHIEVAESVIAKTDSFVFEKNYNNFDKVSSGTQFAIDGETHFILEEDSYILFPKTKIQKNTPTCYLAHEIS